MNKSGTADRGNNKGPSHKFSIGLTLAVLAGLLLAVAAGSYSRLAMRMPSTVNNTRLTSVAAGTVLNLMVEVTALPSPNQLNARLLDKHDANYVRTDKSVQLRLQADTRMMMGKRDDLRPGAVLEVSAVARGRDMNQFFVKSLTVLTDYVQIN